MSDRAVFLFVSVLAAIAACLGIAALLIRADEPIVPPSRLSLPLVVKRASDADMWLPDAEQATLRKLLATTGAKLPPVKFYRPKQFTDDDYGDERWLMPGGMRGLTGWRSYLASSTDDFDGGQVLIDMLVNVRTQKVFVLRTAQNEGPTEDDWRMRTAFSDRVQWVQGYEGHPVCSSCHTTGKSAPRSVHGRISFR